MTADAIDIVSTLQVSDPKSLRFLNILKVDLPNGQKLSFTTPKLRLCMGLFAMDFDNSRKPERVHDVSNATKITLPMSIDTVPYDDSEKVKAWMNNMHAIDAHFKKVIRENANDWFGREQGAYIRKNIDDLYTPIIKPAGDYPPMFCPRIRTDKNGHLTTNFFDESGTPIKDHMNEIVPHSLAKAMCEIEAIAQVPVTKKFYVLLRCNQVKVYEKPTDAADADVQQTQPVCTIED